MLRFYLSWDDTKSLYGEQQNYILHYFLADKTVEVREKYEPNSGKVRIVRIGIVMSGRTGIGIEAGR